MKNKPNFFIGPRCPWGPIYGSGCLKLSGSRAVCRLILGTLSEKNGIMWGKFPSGGPPPPPQFGKPLLSKKKLGLFLILGPQEHFWFSPKNHHFG